MCLEQDVIQAQKGNKDAFARLIKNLEPSMYRVAKSFFYSDVECADVMQDVILKVLRNIRSLQKPEYFKTWLIRILINECKNALKKKQRVIYMKEIPIEQNCEKDFEKVEVWEAINTLNENQRLIVILFYFENLSLGEISQLLDLPEGTVKSRLARARESLSKFLGVKKGESPYHEQPKGL